MSFFKKGTMAYELALAIRLLAPSFTEDTFFVAQ